MSDSSDYLCEHGYYSGYPYCSSSFKDDIPLLQSRLKSAEDKIERMKGLLKRIEHAFLNNDTDLFTCILSDLIEDDPLWKEIQEGK